MLHMGDEEEIPRSIEEQAEFWVNNYRHDGDTSYFNMAAKLLENGNFEIFKSFVISMKSEHKNNMGVYGHNYDNVIKG